MASVCTQNTVHNSEHNTWNDLPTSFGSRKRHSNSKSSKVRSQVHVDVVQAEVNDMFEKKFHFKPEGDEWELPEPNEMFKFIKWEDNDLQNLKRKLNNVKNKLNNFDLDSWHKHTRLMNKAGDVQWRLRSDFEPEFMTQAWCKFYENAAAFPLIPETVSAKFCSVHLCEAPGAFITSLNHYLKQNRPNLEWDWLATTLNPYHEGNPLSSMINDDRFIMQTLPHWCFGQDSTGNLMCVKNMAHLVQRARAKGNVMLVTADGSIDCQEDPGEQESVVSRLHYCETIAALHILAPGGSFLLKMFTLFECDTICLMYLLNCAFKRVSVNKPATSKEGNSEVYVVCLEYRGVDFMQPWLKVLMDHYGPQNLRNSMFQSVFLPEDFMDQLEECAEKFVNYQVKVIEKNISTYISRYDLNWVKKVKQSVAQRFVELYQIKRLPELKELVGRKILKHMDLRNIEPRSEVGSFNDRRRRAYLPPIEALATMHQELETLDVKWSFKEDIQWLKLCEEKVELRLQTGQPVHTVYSSKFCIGKLLRIRNQVRRLAGSASLSQSGDALDKTFESSDLSEELSRQFPNALVVDFKESLWSSLEDGSNGHAETGAFFNIKLALHQLWPENTLIIVGYPMLTQFNAGLIYTAGHMFERVGFVRPRGRYSAVVFDTFRQWDSDTMKLLDRVGQSVVACHEVQSTAVLAILPIETLCGGNKAEANSLVEEESNASVDFYSCVLEVNNICVVEQTSAVLNTLLNTSAMFNTLINSS